MQLSLNVLATNINDFKYITIETLIKYIILDIKLPICSRPKCNL